MDSSQPGGGSSSHTYQTRRLRWVQGRRELRHTVAPSRAAVREQVNGLPLDPELLSVALSAHPVGLALLAGDELRFLYSNPSYQTMTPHPEQELVGLTYEEVWQPEEGFRGGWLIRRIQKTGKPFHMDHYVQQYPDGSVRYFTLDLRRLRWEQSEAVLIVLADTTKLENAYLRAEQAAAIARLRAAEADEGRRILDALLDYLPEGITIAAAPDGAVLRISRYGEEMIGTGRENLMGAPLRRHSELWGFVYPHRQTPVASDELPLSRAVLHGEVVRNEEWVLLRPDGRRMDIVCNAGPIRDHTGQVLGGVLSFQDITERKKVEQAIQDYALRLAKSNRELQDFAFIASHDLQEPLRKIQAFGDRLTTRYQGNLEPEALDYLNRMRNAATRMQGMIADLLAYSRITTKPQPFQQLDLGEIVEQVLVDLEVNVEQTQAQVEVGELPSLEADETQMYQLFQNLVSNALKFHQAGEPPKVEIWGERLNSGEDQVRLFVRDHGIGFDEQYLERIFQPFQRLHGRSEYEGTGIGLAICRKIVEQHSGKITAHSQLGQGTTFEIILPLHPPQKNA